jgi:hypothetical protein
MKMLQAVAHLLSGLRYRDSRDQALRRCPLPRGLGRGLALGLVKFPKLQHYSTTNEKEAITQHAGPRGFEIVRTYATDFAVLVAKVGRSALDAG